MSRKRIRLESGVVIEGAPKSRAGRRVVTLPTAAVDALREHVERFTAGGDDAYVFTAPGGEPLEGSNFRGRVWVPTLRAAGMEGLRFHDLRHTAGTLAAHTGATTKELMARLGHSSAAASLMYQHATAARDRRIAAALDDMVAGRA